MTDIIAAVVFAAVYGAIAYGIYRLDGGQHDV